MVGLCISVVTQSIECSLSRWEGFDRDQQTHPKFLLETSRRENNNRNHKKWRMQVQLHITIIVS